VAVKIRLKRMGKIRAPYYRIVVADSRTRRDGRVIEEIGKYHPKLDPSVIEVETERAQYWLSVGAQPTEAVEAILKVTGDWQKFKGESGTEGTLKVAEPKRSKQDIFNEILKETHSDLGGEATTAKKAPAKKSAAKDDAVKHDAAKDDAAKADAAQDSAAKDEPAPVETTEAAVEATGGDAAVEDTPASEATGASSEGSEQPAAAQEPEAAGSTESTEA
jgi:small subunit ribosomal protein S16